MNKLLLAATTVDQVVGTINPPVDNPLFNKGDVSASLGSIFATAIQIFIFVAAIAALIYMMLGAFDWITSNGEKEKLLKAQNKIQSAAIGLVLVIVVLVVFNVIMGTVLGGKFGFSSGTNGLEFKLPSINSTSP